MKFLSSTLAALAVGGALFAPAAQARRHPCPPGSSDLRYCEHGPGGGHHHHHHHDRHGGGANAGRHG